MKEVIVKLEECTKVVFDSFLWNRVDVEHAELILKIVLKKNDIKELSNYVWKEYVNTLVEYLNLDFDYFEQEHNNEEPYPSSKRTIEENPTLINDYFRNSSMWNDYICEYFLFKKYNKGEFEYYVTDFKEAKYEDEELVISFYGVHKT
jgi:hypothetical protein